MINATPSLEAAEGLSGKDVARYLSARGWVALASKVEGVSIFSKDVGADRPVQLILPMEEGFSDERRRVADALRAVAQIEGQSEAQIADEVRLELSDSTFGNQDENDETTLDILRPNLNRLQKLRACCQMLK